MMAGVGAKIKVDVGRVIVDSDGHWGKRWHQCRKMGGKRFDALDFFLTGLGGDGTGGTGGVEADGDAMTGGRPAGGRPGGKAGAGGAGTKDRAGGAETKD
jgi:hypothetical protein